MCTAMQVEEFGGVYGNAGRGVPVVQVCTAMKCRSSVVCTAMQVEEFGGVYGNASVEEFGGVTTAMQVEEFDMVCHGNAGRGVRWCVRQCR